MMKKLLLTTFTFAALFAGSATAADLARPVYSRPVVVAAPVFSWTGCYVGAHVGWGWGQSHFTDSAGTPNYLIDNFGLGNTASVDQSGAIFGGQVGCDYQFTNFVVGISGSVAGADINGTQQDPYLHTYFSSGLITAKTDFLADISGRLGFTWGRALIYGKGGFAWGDSKYTAGTCFCAGNGPAAFVASNTATSVLAGAGIEWAFALNWSAFVEYNHYFFGTKTLNFTSQYAGRPYSALVDVKEDINAVKIGVNYRFDYAPVVTK